MSALSAHIRYTNTGISDKTNFGMRVLDILRQQQRSKAWLAEKIGISKQAMNYLLNHSLIPKYVPEISEVLQVNPIWLESGHGDIQINQSEMIRTIPVQEMAHLDKDEISNSFDMIAIDPAYPAACFATRLDTHSMEPLFPRNSILIFERAYSPQNGDFILFKTSDHNVQFRKYFKDGADVYLRPIDSSYAEFINQDIFILGILLESRNHFR